MNAWSASMMHVNRLWSKTLLRLYKRMCAGPTGNCRGTVDIWLKNHTIQLSHLRKEHQIWAFCPRKTSSILEICPHNKWGLCEEVKKVLWVMCDEKWFHGLVPRANAKSCEELGIMKQTYSAHHKKHIAKVMVNCTVAYCFEGASYTITYVLTQQTQ